MTDRTDASRVLSQLFGHDTAEYMPLSSNPLQGTASELSLRRATVNSGGVLRVRAPFLAIQFACFVPGASPRTATLSTSRVLSRHDRLIRRPSCRFSRSGPALVCNGSTKGATAGHRRYLSFRSHHLVRPYRTAGIIRGFNE